MSPHSTFLVVFLVTSLLVVAAQRPTLKILPDVKSLSRPSNQRFALTCRGEGGDANLLSELKWITPAGDEINDIYIRDKNPDFEVIKTNENLYLYFNKPRSDQSGRYRCRALLQQSDFLYGEIHVNIYEDVTWEQCREVQYLIKGNRGERINCRARANPKPNIIWKKDNRLIDNNPRYFINSSGIVIKEAVSEKDGGVFEVSALVTETGASHQRRITVQIYSKPEIVTITDLAKGIEDDQIELKCQASGVPEPLYTWLDGSRRNLSTVGGYAVDRNGGSLIISRLKKLVDHGNFTCIAENSAGRSERTAQLLVYVRSKVRSFVNMTFDEGKESWLECRATGDPLPTLSLRKDNLNRPFQVGDARIRLEEHIEKDERILRMTYLNTTRADDGLYYCRAENQAGPFEVVGHLQVKFRPDMSLTPLTKVKTWDSRPVNMTCIADAIPNATIKWYKNGYEIFPSEIYRIVDNNAGVSKLFITPNKLSYDQQAYGPYRCEAINSLGKGYIFIDLEKATVPGYVNEMKAIEITPTLIKFKIFGDLFDGGLPIKKIHAEYFNLNDPSDRNIIDFPYSKIENIFIIDKLKPFSSYKFRFSAENEVGSGQYGQELLLQTKAETVPDRPEFHNLVTDPMNKDEFISPYAHKYTPMWNLPPDNGRRIKMFEVKYYQVKKAEYGVTPLTEPNILKIADDPKTSVTLHNLKADSYYRIELRAYNDLGYSQPANLIFRTAAGGAEAADDDSYGDVNISSIPVGIITAIIILIIVCLLVIMDIVFYVRYKVGAIYFMRTHLCNVGGEDGHKLSSNYSAQPHELRPYRYRNEVLDRAFEPRPHGGGVVTTEVDNPAFDEREHYAMRRADHRDSVV